ncbi:hypothetical protein AX16_008550 [Volvariella volvacea WC 439]|nr:hypothetical protein AX16_008550 [Volvariella volvacea WC 439]
MLSLVGSINKSGAESSANELGNMTALVTGGTGGIGFEVARGLATTGMRVLLLSRKEEHGEEAVSKIKEMSQQPVDVSFVQCDLGNLNQVREVGDKIEREEKRLDLVVGDAGIGVNAFGLTSDGIERHFGVNHLGHFLLLNRVFPLIQRTSKLRSVKPPRVIMVSSELHRATTSNINFASPNEITPPSAEEQAKLPAHFLYARSKLANILFIKGLYQRIIKANQLDILTLATHPGAVHTGQQDQFKEAYGQVLGSILKGLTVPFMRNPEQGSLSTLWAAMSPAVLDEADANSRDQRYKWQASYVTDPGTFGKETAQADDEQLGRNLWGLSETMISEKLGSDALGPWVKDG